MGDCIFLLLSTCSCAACMNISWALVYLTRSRDVVAAECSAILESRHGWDGFFLSLCSQRTPLCPNLPSSLTLQLVAAAEAMTGLFQVIRGALTSTPPFLLSRKWHTRLAKPAWFHLRALAFSHALISDWLKWRTVTTNQGTKLADCRYPGYLLMLGWQNQFSGESRIMNGECECVWLGKKKRVTYMGYWLLLHYSHQPTQL